jgi:peptide/nickel transport system substrate-binding protein/oligopeptide transport system substrate-binding protein
LLEFDELAQLQPAIASEWSISDDKLIYTFKLRDDIRFHKVAAGKPTYNGGRLLDAQDVLYSFRRLLKPQEDSQAAFFWMIKGAREFSSGESPDISGIRVVASHTIVFELEKPFAPFISLLAMANTFVVPHEDAEGQPGGLAAVPVGTGAFRWQGRQGDTLMLTANENYFRGRPWLEHLEFPVIRDEIERFTAFNQGRLSHVDVPDSQYRNVKQDPARSACLIETNLWGSNYLGMNLQKPPFNNRLVRQALNYALDRETIVRIVLNGRVQVANGVLPPGVPGHNDAMSGYSYDLTRARQLLAEAGFPDGQGFPQITLQYNRDAIHSRTAEFILANLRDIGINCVVRELEFGEHLTSVEEGNVEFFRMGWTVDYPDPDSFLYTLFHSSNIGSGYNFSHINNPEIDALLDRARFETSMEKRIPLYHQVEKLIVDEAPWVFLHFYSAHLLHRPEVKGIKLGPMGESLMQYRHIWLANSDASRSP